MGSIIPLRTIIKTSIKAGNLENTNPIPVLTWTANVYCQLSLVQTESVVLSRSIMNLSLICDLLYMISIEYYSSLQCLWYTFQLICCIVYVHGVMEVYGVNIKEEAVFFVLVARFMYHSLKRNLMWSFDIHMLLWKEGGGWGCGSVCSSLMGYSVGKPHLSVYIFSITKWLHKW